LPWDFPLKDDDGFTSGHGNIKERRDVTVVKPKQNAENSWAQNTYKIPPETHCAFPEDVGESAVPFTQASNSPGQHLLGSRSSPQLSAPFHAYTQQGEHSNRVMSAHVSRRVALANSQRSPSPICYSELGTSIPRLLNRPASCGSRRHRAVTTEKYEAFCSAADQVTWIANGHAGQGSTGGNIIGVKCFYDKSCYQKLQTARLDKKKKPGIGPLPLIFKFYSKLQAPASQYGKSLDFTDFERINNTMSFFELLVALRDYRIVPQIVNKSEVAALWQVFVQERNKKFQKKNGSSAGARQADLFYNDFLDILSRIALLGFGKPGFRKEVENAELRKLGWTEEDLQSKHKVRPHLKISAKSKVEFFASLLPLESAEKIRERLRTQGRETQGRINARSKGETSTFNVEEMRRNRQIARLSRLMVDQGLSSNRQVQNYAAHLTSMLENGDSEEFGADEDQGMSGELNFGNNDSVKLQRHNLENGNVIVDEGAVGPDGLTFFPD